MLTSVLFVCVVTNILHEGLHIVSFYLGCCTSNYNLPATLPPGEGILPPRWNGGRSVIAPTGTFFKRPWERRGRRSLRCHQKSPELSLRAFFLFQRLTVPNVRSFEPSGY